MTTKEEVLRLAEAAGFHINLGAIYSPSTWDECNVQITKLIELAKQAGAAEEREACIKLCLDKRQLSCPEAINWNIALVSGAEAIRNRETKLNKEEK